ncbi:MULTISPECIES: PQQ-dependent sugar dehydrogenase [unclassified Planococcus (in: firmicutes)]|uniref:PQQ-dependent sugar dehydrogenase n=1 Tax=unclassified Planococcus (in: firmicutes) TaxID=2662419 RepID=UPI000C31FD50|nr:MULTISPECIES: PQQ-dependent sugar dehydrogenase [unclassified Planococcus (in: firmicutes)]AUD13840.1 glucose dehydrogenase [Planococcus sp. MB-3u-03]PKG45656.1 glucose dehydrogenase [Planococcus sp. Urea-trap-24]PKG88634.1 glucose dehydrogenase [Planococcus sp. Urea-3u-39]PKH38647.1 glucose dehydrogenase [Planococcus sp. MB-3u-09]
MTKNSWSRLMSLTVLSSVLALAACGNEDASEEESTNDSDATTEESTDEGATTEESADEGANESAETEPKVTEFEPAFPEQTRAPAVETETELNEEVVVEGLGVTWGMVEFEPNRLLVTQRDAAELLIVNLEEGSVSDPIEGTPEVNNSGQGGLLDVAVAPDFDESRAVFMTFSQDVEGGTVTAVGKGVLSEDESSLEDFEVIFQATPAYEGDLHYGGRIIFDEEGNLFLTTGERSDDPIRERAQDLDAYLGKVIHITQDGEPVDSNPFVEDEDALDGIYSYGHRNIQGIDYNPETGDLWIVEFGPQAGDELNIIEPANNYGWPIVSYGIEYTGELINDGISEHEAQGFVEPRYYWDPTSAPSGMSFYDNDAIPEWENNLFIGGLAPNYIVRVVIEDDIIVGEERLLTDEVQRFRDILVTEDGALIASTDGGLIYQITAAE